MRRSAVSLALFLQKAMLNQILNALFELSTFVGIVPLHFMIAPVALNISSHLIEPSLKCLVCQVQKVGSEILP